MCHHSQSESIELEDFLDDEGMLCESYDESGRQEQDGITEKQLEKLKEFFSQAITTAVAKREQEILEEAKKKISSAGGIGGWKHLEDILDEVILKH